jgi:nucleotide-binding universal stress UspA family protein
MGTIQKILFPVDFSAACDAMTPFVQRVAAMFSANVTLVYGLEPSNSGYEVLARPAPEAEEDRKKVACARLEEYLSTEFPPHENHRLLLMGDAATRIAEVARARAFDLIIMPTHAGVFRKMLLGSTTAKVLNDADCMVLTTQHAETISPRPLEHREWVCAIGLSEDSTRVLRIASQLADTAHARLSIIHAIASAQPGLPVQLDLEERVQSMEKRAARDRVNELQKTVGSHASVHIALGPIKNALTETARELQADGLIIGRSSQPGSRGRLRDLTYGVVRDSPCPVISI